MGAVRGVGGTRCAFESSDSGDERISGEDGTCSAIDRKKTRRGELKQIFFARESNQQVVYRGVGAHCKKVAKNAP